MNIITVTVETVTYAMKLRKLLSRAGIKSELVKIADKKESSGCMHGITIRSLDYYSAIVVLKDSGIPYSIRNG